MRVSINLATRPFADLGPTLKRLRIAMAVLAVVAMGLGLGLHFMHAKAEIARARVHSLDADIARITTERQGYETMMRRPDNAQVLEQAATLNRLFDEKAFSWTLAMEDLETVLPGGVQVTTLEPTRAKNGQITLRLRVIGPRNKAVDLVQNLEHSRRFLQPRIVGESAEAAGNPGERLEPVSTSNRVNFDVLAEYNPVGLDERRPSKAKPAKIGTSIPAHAATHGAGGSSAGGSIAGGSIAGGSGLRRPPSAGRPQPRPKVKPRAGGPQ